MLRRIQYSYSSSLSLLCIIVEILAVNIVFFSENFQFDHFYIINCDNKQTFFSDSKNKFS